jgi:hypothetical protein
MKKRDKKDLELEFIYNELFDKMVELVLRYNEPQMVASTMMAQSLRLYKTVFKYPGEFKEVIETVLKQSEDIEPFNHKTLH